MSTFSVRIKRIRAIEPHPNADAIEFALVDGYRSIVKKGQFQPGQLMVYLPEGALLPDELIQELGLWNEKTHMGKLGGPQGNRITAMRLRGELSQGIVMAVSRELEIEFSHTFFAFEGARELQEGDDVAELLRVTKYVPEIPESLRGAVFVAGREPTLAFDVEDFKAFPDVLQEGEEVVFTEKLHGTCTIVAILPYKDALEEAFGERKNVLVFSKGLGAEGLAFKNNETNESNLYVRATRALRERYADLSFSDGAGPEEPLFLLGETFGPDVQDLPYGRELGFRLFAVARGYRGNQRYLDWDVVQGSYAAQFQLETVPVLYRGPFNLDAMRRHTRGRTTLDAAHMREGLVMVPAVERTAPYLGRVCLKSVSEDYLTRKGGTEFN